MLIKWKGLYFFISVSDTDTLSMVTSLFSFTPQCYGFVCWNYLVRVVLEVPATSEELGFSKQLQALRQYRKQTNFNMWASTLRTTQNCKYHYKVRGKAVKMSFEMNSSLSFLHLWCLYPSYFDQRHHYHFARLATNIFAVSWGASVNYHASITLCKSSCVLVSLSNTMQSWKPAKVKTDIQNIF